MELQPRYLSAEEKLEIIESIEAFNAITDEDIIILDTLSKDEESEVRAKVAEILVFSKSPSAERILISLLKDSDELVRINACDSLCISNSSEVLDLLKNKVMKDRSSLVRGYATLSIADIATKIEYNNLEELLDFFKLVLKKEKVEWVRINVYKALYKLGDETNLNLLINGLNSRLYRNRCATVNCLKDIISSKNNELVRFAFTERFKIEKTVAVRNNIEDIIKSI